MATLQRFPPLGWESEGCVEREGAIPPRHVLSSCWPFAQGGAEEGMGISLELPASHLSKRQPSGQVLKAQGKNQRAGGSPPRLKGAWWLERLPLG